MCKWNLSKLHSKGGLSFVTHKLPLIIHSNACHSKHALDCDKALGVGL